MTDQRPAWLRLQHRRHRRELSAFLLLVAFGLGYAVGCYL